MDGTLGKSKWMKLLCCCVLLCCFLLNKSWQMMENEKKHHGQLIDFSSTDFCIKKYFLAIQFVTYLGAFQRPLSVNDPIIWVQTKLTLYTAWTTSLKSWAPAALGHRSQEHPTRVNRSTVRISCPLPPPLPGEQEWDQPGGWRVAAAPGNIPTFWSRMTTFCDLHHQVSMKPCHMTSYWASTHYHPRPMHAPRLSLLLLFPTYTTFTVVLLLAPLKTFRAFSKFFSCSPKHQTIITSHGNR